MLSLIHIYGGIFLCSPVPEIQQTIEGMLEVLFLSGMLGLIMAVVLIYFFSKRLTKPLLEVNKAAKIIADGNFDRRLSIDSNDEIGQLADSFNYMAESLEKKDQDRRLFVASVAHDLRSPLTSIQGFVQAMKDGMIPEEKYDYYMGIILEEMCIRDSVTIAGYTSATTVCLAPNPPPTQGFSTCIFESGIPRALASI